MPVISSPNHWVVIEVHELEDTIEYLVEPGTLHLRPGFAGHIIWQVFTPGWELAGVTFPPGSLFDGSPQPDLTRPGCWSTAASNDGTGSFSYSVTVRPVADPSKEIRIDPVVENDPPPPTFAKTKRPASRRQHLQ